GRFAATALASLAPEFNPERKVRSNAEGCSRISSSILDMRSYCSGGPNFCGADHARRLTMWRTHSCVPRRDFSRRLLKLCTHPKASRESRRGTHECVRHIYTKIRCFPPRPCWDSTT